MTLDQSKVKADAKNEVSSFTGVVDLKFV